MQGSGILEVGRHTHLAPHTLYHHPPMHVIPAQKGRLTIFQPSKVMVRSRSFRVTGPVSTILLLSPSRKPLTLAAHFSTAEGVCMCNWMESGKPSCGGLC